MSKASKDNTLQPSPGYSTRNLRGFEDLGVSTYFESIFMHFPAFRRGTDTVGQCLNLETLPKYAHGQAIIRQTSKGQSAAETETAYDALK